MAHKVQSAAFFSRRQSIHCCLLASWVGNALRLLSNSKALGVVSNDPGVNGLVRRGEVISSCTVEMNGRSLLSPAASFASSKDSLLNGWGSVEDCGKI